MANGSPQQRHADRVRFMRSLVGQALPFPGSDRVGDKAKQWCRRNTLVFYKAGKWQVTDLGERFIRANAVSDINPPGRTKPDLTSSDMD